MSTAYISAFYNPLNGIIEHFRITSDPDSTIIFGAWPKIIGEVKADDYNSAVIYATEILERIKRISCKKNIVEYNSVIKIDRRN